MLLLFVALLLALSLLPAAAAQSNETLDYQVIKSKRSESFVLPYSASNHDLRNPLVYTYDEPKGSNWILTIQNNMSYAARPDAKTIIKILEPAPSEKYIEIAMFGEESQRFWAAVNVPDTGYARIYDQETNGWSRDEPVVVAYGENQGLTVTNGKRIILDRLDLDGFTVGSISVYGKDEENSLINTYAGNISFEIVFGNPADSPLYYLPLAIMAGIGAVVGGLLVFKKRKPSD